MVRADGSIVNVGDFVHYNNVGTYELFALDVLYRQQWDLPNYKLRSK